MDSLYRIYSAFFEAGAAFLKSFLPKSLYGIRWDLSWARNFFAHVFGAFLLILDATVDEALGDVYRRQKFSLSVAFQLTLSLCKP